MGRWSVVQAAEFAVVKRGWKPIATAPKSTVLLIYAGYSYEIGHFNEALNAWVDCWQHRPIKATHWQPLPAAPSHAT